MMESICTLDDGSKGSHVHHLVNDAKFISTGRDIVEKILSMCLFLHVV